MLQRARSFERRVPVPPAETAIQSDVDGAFDSRINLLRTARQQFALRSDIAPEIFQRLVGHIAALRWRYAYVGRIILSRAQAMPRKSTEGTRRLIRQHAHASGLKRARNQRRRLP